MAQAIRTHDRETIIKWVEDRKGKPSKIKGTGGKDDAGILRIHFPLASDSDNFQEISWDEFFKEFEKNKLDFLYQEKKEDGEKSSFHKLVHRE